MFSGKVGALQTLIICARCGETQTMSHIVESCPITKLNGGLSQLHSAVAAAIALLTMGWVLIAYARRRRRSGKV